MIGFPLQHECWEYSGGFAINWICISPRSSFPAYSCNVTNGFSSMPGMSSEVKCISSILVQRYKRFLADVRLSTGEIVTAHCTNTGSMLGCNEPGNAVYLSRSESKGRKLAYTWEMIEIQRSWVGIRSEE